jgi:hypothetical protein
MCCVTHPYRDQLARAQAARLGQSAFVESLMAPSDDWRCRCALTTEPCQRRATGEDLNCDWCRQTDHADWARRNLPMALGGQADAPRDFGGFAGSVAVYDEMAGFSANFYQAGLAGLSASAVGQLTPAEISRLLGPPKL